MCVLDVEVDDVDVDLDVDVDVGNDGAERLSSLLSTRSVGKSLLFFPLRANIFPCTWKNRLYNRHSLFLIIYMKSQRRTILLP